MRSLLIALCLATTAAAVAAPPSDIDAYVERAIRTFEVPGMAVSVVENGKTTLAKGYGVRKVGTRDAVDAHTLFPIASNTKAFTAAALAILVDEGKLAWDDRVTDRLPGFRMYDAYVTQEMTVRDLLVHRSGLGLGAGDLMFFPPTDLTRKQIVERLRYIKPATSFRSGYAYDNVLYIAAGALVEQVSGESWEQFVQHRVLDALGMSDSVSTPSAIKTENSIWPHARLDGPMRGLGHVVALERDRSNDNAAPAGAINTSATDIAHWLQVQLDRGALPGGRRLFSESSAAEMWTPRTLILPSEEPDPIPELTPSFRTYALGWFVEDYRGHKIVTHSGAVDGAKSATLLIPEKHVGIAVMINSEDGAARWAVFYRLLDHYLGLPDKDWIAPWLAARDQITAKGLATLREQQSSKDTDAPSGKPSLPLARYAGVYRDPWYGDVTISMQGNGLAIRFEHTPAFSGALEYYRYDTFRTRFKDRNVEDAYVTFALTPAGAIDHVKMEAVSPLADFSFDFSDLLFTPVPQSTTQGK
jgi:CubicO group peptidase (beta-lactamase class C family)